MLMKDGNTRINQIKKLFFCKQDEEAKVEKNGHSIASSCSSVGVNGKG